VTHLPQVASRADHHLRVSKTVQSVGRGKAAGEFISSSVQALDPDERREEIARMLGGKRITDTTRAHAAEMIEASRRQPADTVEAPAPAAAVSRASGTAGRRRRAS